MAKTVDKSSKYYPYEKVFPGYNTMDGAEMIPDLICRYLLDLPLEGYEAPDNNEYPRCKLAKYLWYDEPNPLNNPLPTTAEKLSMIYDGRQPVVNNDAEKELHPKGFRVYPLYLFPQAQLEAQTMLKCYVNRVLPYSPYKTTIGISFDIIVNGNIEVTMGDGSLSKAYAIEQTIISALHGVNIAGVGVVMFDKSHHGDNGSNLLDDKLGINVGRHLDMSIDWQESGERILH